MPTVLPYMFHASRLIMGNNIPDFDRVEKRSKNAQELLSHKAKITGRNPKKVDSWLVRFTTVLRVNLFFRASTRLSSVRRRINTTASIANEATYAAPYSGCSRPDCRRTRVLMWLRRSRHQQRSKPTRLFATSHFEDLQEAWLLMESSLAAPTSSSRALQKLFSFS